MVRLPATDSRDRGALIPCRGAPVVTDDAGRRLGNINGKLVNQIPGAQVNRMISAGDWTDNIAPDFFVPADIKYTITIDGSSPTTADTERSPDPATTYRSTRSRSGRRTRTPWSSNRTAPT